MEYTMNNLLNIKSFLKFLSRNKGYTAIDVFGLSVSLMFVILIAVYVERELNIDKQQANYDVLRHFFVQAARWRPQPAVGRSLRRGRFGKFCP